MSDNRQLCPQVIEALKNAAWLRQRSDEERKHSEACQAMENARRAWQTDWRYKVGGYPEP